MKNNKQRIKLSWVIVIMLLVIMLPGCGAHDQDIAEDDTVSTEQTVDDQQDSSNQAVSDGYEDIDISSLGGDGVDVDLTKLSATMVYSVVNDMMMRPNEYLGKMIRMKGAMSYYYDEETGSAYYACIIKDATACCAQGIEFQTTDEFDPADYPAEGKDLTVSGKYDIYEDNGYQYCVLKDAIIE